MTYDPKDDDIARRFKYFGVTPLRAKQTYEAYHCAIGIVTDDDQPVKNSVFNVLAAVQFALREGYRGTWHPITDEMAERMIALIGLEIEDRRNDYSTGEDDAEDIA